MPQTKDQKITFRCTKEEKEHLTALADSKGKSVSDFIISLCLSQDQDPESSEWDTHKQEVFCTLQTLDNLLASSPRYLNFHTVRKELHRLCQILK